MSILRTQHAGTETLENLDLWRKNSEPSMSRSQAIAAILKRFFEEHEKELKKYRSKEGKTE